MADITHTLKVAGRALFDSSVDNLTFEFPASPDNGDVVAITNMATNNYNPCSLNGMGNNIRFPGGLTVGTGDLVLHEGAIEFEWVDAGPFWYPTNPFVNPMTFHGQWVSGRMYPYRALVNDGGWEMVANKQTTEQAAPQPGGNPVYMVEIPGVPTWSTETQNVPTWITGNRFVFGKLTQIQSFRWYAPDASGDFTFEIWSANDSGSVQQIVAAVVPFSVGWAEIPFTQIARASQTLDLMVVGRSTIAPSSFTYNWNVANRTGDPVSGEATFQNNALELRVHNNDAGATDRRSDLTSVTIGGTLEFASTTWTIVDVFQGFGDHVRYTLTPNQGRPTGGQYALTFEWGTSGPIPYVEDLDHFNYAWPSGSIQGFKTATYDGSPTLTNNAYGIDVLADEYTLPTDWDFFSKSSV